MPLEIIRPDAVPAANCSFERGGCTPPGHGEPPPEILARIRTHPCYSDQAHHHFARIHLPVAPACNVQCHYCNRRYDCANESRPGVTSERLDPDAAQRRALEAAAVRPELSVVGIAGPGDALANPERTFGTLERIRRALPDVKLCVSTNGLALPDHVHRLVDLGVEHLTVTINMVDTEIGARIYAWVVWNGRKVLGKEAARILSERQMEGLAAAAARGILCKVNSVVIPGVNDEHLPEVSRRIRTAGAFIHNLMPLLSAPEHGTHYGLTGQRGPTAAELERVQQACGDSRMMRHCRQCRADAVGLLGEARAPRAATAPPLADAAAARAAHRAAAAHAERMARAERDEAAEAVRGTSLRVRIAVATRGGGMVNQHFGHAREFQIYDASADGVRLVGIRKVEDYCRGGEAEESALEPIIRALADCEAVLVARVGRCPREELQAARIDVVDAHAFQSIEAAALRYLAERADRGGAAESAPPPREQARVG